MRLPVAVAHPTVTIAIWQKKFRNLDKNMGNILVLGNINKTIRDDLIDFSHSGTKVESTLFFR
jgi:hypothetical protein